MRGAGRQLRRSLLRSALVCGALIISAVTVADEGRDNDPLETFNRAIFSFNDTADKWLLKPIARGYRAVTPNPVEHGVGRMFSNLGEVLSVVNDVMQGKFGQAGNDSGRFLVNSTVGLVGFFDVAQHWGMPKSDGEDFGQTFGVWGMGQGSYLVLPFLGPSTFRDAPGRALDSFLNPIGYVDHVPTRNEIYGANVLSVRAELLEAEKLITGDKYSFMRDVYLQRREYLTLDGQVEDDFGDDEYQ
ncbi:MAG: VacJ family lipoprotein [Porticoccaceae bacterium]|nr:VacJ family lipoprotein [Porticoccaceae bacterium]